MPQHQTPQSTRRACEDEHARHAHQCTLSTGGLEWRSLSVHLRIRWCMPAVGLRFQATCMPLALQELTTIPLCAQKVMVVPWALPGGKCRCLPGLLVLCDMELMLCLLWVCNRASPGCCLAMPCPFTPLCTEADTSLRALIALQGHSTHRCLQQHICDIQIHPASMLGLCEESVCTI